MTRAELMRHAHLHRQQTKTPGHCPGAFLLEQTLIDYAALAFRFLRQSEEASSTYWPGSVCAQVQQQFLTSCRRFECTVSS
jgi:hypothetical protein